MARWQGTTAERGYHHEHRKERERRLALYRPGQPCAECGLPILYWPLDFARTMVDLPHDHINGGYKPGLAHRACNRGEGASRSGTKTKITSARPGDVRCKTCGQAYHYAARICETCGKHYHPSGKTVRTCSRTCGIELRRRLYGHASRWPPKPKC